MWQRSLTLSRIERRGGEEGWCLENGGVLILDLICACALWRGHIIFPRPVPRQLGRQAGPIRRRFNHWLHILLSLSFRLASDCISPAAAMPLHHVTRPWQWMTPSSSPVAACSAPVIILLRHNVHEQAPGFFCSSCARLRTKLCTICHRADGVTTSQPPVPSGRDPHHHSLASRRRAHIHDQIPPPSHRL